MLAAALAPAVSGQTVTEFAIPTPNSRPAHIAAGPDGALWFTGANFSDKIGRITTAGAFTTVALPFGSDAYGIAAGPDSAMWFTDASTNKIGRVSLSAVASASIPALSPATLFLLGIAIAAQALLIQR
jgi:virginiamycin B lyase